MQIRMGSRALPPSSRHAMNDLRLALRILFKSPGFSLISIATLALGIGLNTSMFSLMNMLLLQPLRYPDTDHLVRVYRTTPQVNNADHSGPNWLDLSKESGKFADLAAYRMWGVTLKQSDRPAVNLNALRVSAEFFPVLGLQPELGRVFTREEDQPGNHVIVLSHQTWQDKFSGDPAVVGQTVRVDGEPTTIIGVMPASFTSLFLWGPGDAFRPLALNAVEKVNPNEAALKIIGRRHGDITLAQLNARLATVGEALARLRPRASSKDGLRAVTLQSTASNSTTQEVTWLLLGLSGFVLLIACGNLANLQLSRGMARRQEFAICAALGASRARLLRPLLAESLLLSLAGGAVGILVAIWANAWLSARMSANGFVVFTLTIDWKVLVFALGVSVATGLVFGIVPAWLMSRVSVSETLKSGGRGSTGTRAQHRFRHSLIVAQVALALVLLSGAGVFIRGIDGMMARELGWNSDGLLQWVMNLPQARYTTEAQAYSFYTRLQERLAALPGVERVSVSWSIPVIQFLTSRGYVVEGRDPPAPGHEPSVNVNGITPSYLATLGIKLEAGRNFTEADGPASPDVALINEPMARALFPNESPIGRRIGSPDPTKRAWVQVVGVIPDQKMALGFVPPVTPYQVYRPMAQETWNYVTVSVRAAAPETLAEPARRILVEMDPDIPIQQMSTVRQLVKQLSNGLDMVSSILVAFAALGLFLSALGLYGVIAHLVLQRTPEIGVRLALGAPPRKLVWLVLGSGVRLTLIGTALGLLGAYGLARFLAVITPNPEMPPQGPLAVIAAILLLNGLSLLACWLPARRATKVDPLTALRAE